MLPKISINENKINEKVPVERTFSCDEKRAAEFEFGPSQRVMKPGTRLDSEINSATSRSQLHPGREVYQPQKEMAGGSETSRQVRATVQHGSGNREVCL